MRCSRAGLDTRRPLGHLLQLRASPGSATLQGGQEAVQTELLCGLRGAGTGTPHSLTACPSALPPLPLSTRHHLPGPPGSASWERGDYSRPGCPVSSRRGPAHGTQLGSLELPHGDRVTGGGGGGGGARSCCPFARTHGLVPVPGTSCCSEAPARLTSREGDRSSPGRGPGISTQTPGPRPQVHLLPVSENADSET